MLYTHQYHFNSMIVSTTILFFHFQGRKLHCHHRYNWLFSTIIIVMWNCQNFVVRMLKVHGLSCWIIYYGQVCNENPTLTNDHTCNLKILIMKLIKLFSFGFGLSLFCIYRYWFPIWPMSPEQSCYFKLWRDSAW